MTRRIAVGLLALALAIPFPAFAQGGAGNLRPQIEKLVQAWQDAYNAGDAAAVAALYTTDAKLLVPGAEPGSGPKAIQELIAADIALGGKLTLTLVDVVGFGDYALETGSWVATSPDASIWITARTWCSTRRRAAAGRCIGTCGTAACRRASRGAAD